MNSTKRKIVDIIVLVLIGIWLMGGIPWGGRLLLKHGADPRRAAIFLTLLIAWAFPQLRTESLVLRWVRKAGEQLLLPRVRWTVLAGAATWAAVVGVLQTMALRYPMWDVGIFHQVIWSLAHGHGFTSTISGAGNFLRDHLSPSLIFLVPFYWISGSSPITLGWLSSLLIFGGVAAWIYLAEKLEGVAPEVRARIAAATLVFGLSFDSLWANQRWGFHENMLGFAALSWGFAFLLSEASSRSWRKIAAFVCFLIAAGSKETLLLSVAMILVVWFLQEFSKKRDPFAIKKSSDSIFDGALLGSAICLILVFVLFELMPHPADKNYFKRYYGYLGSGLGQFLSTVFFSPGKVVHEIGAGELAGYFKDVFLPWLGLPLFWIAWTMKPRKMGKVPHATFYVLLLLTISTSFLSAALSTYSALRQTGFHYVLELWPALAVLTILALGKIESTALGSRLKVSWVWAIFALISLGQDPWGSMRVYGTDALRERSARAGLRMIAPGAAVVADEMTGPWLAGRLAITRWPDFSLLPGSCPEWIVNRKNLPMTQGEIAWQLSRCQAAQGMGSIWSPVWSTDTWVGYQLVRSHP